MGFLFYETKSSRYKELNFQQTGPRSITVRLFEIQRILEINKIWEISKNVFESGGMVPLQLQSLQNSKQRVSPSTYLDIFVTSADFASGTAFGFSLRVKVILDASSSWRPVEWPLTAIDGAVSLMVCLTPASVRLESVSVLSVDDTAEGDMTLFVMTNLKLGSWDQYRREALETRRENRSNYERWTKIDLI